MVSRRNFWSTEIQNTTLQPLEAGRLLQTDSQIPTTIEAFVKAFNRCEAEAGVFALRDAENYPWWDLVRYRVQFALCVERDLHRYSSASALPSKFVRAKSFARQMRRLVRDVTRLRGHRIREARTLVVSKRSLDYIDTIAGAEAERGRAVLLVNRSGEAPAPQMALTYQSIQFLTRMVQRAQRLPPAVDQAARRLAYDIRVRFDSQVDVFGVIATKYREEMVARRIWSVILDQAGAVERVIYVNDDTLKSLVMLARARGIDTEEVQHAYMGQAHIGFSYPPLDSALATLPDRVIITRDTGDITYPVERVEVKTTSKQRGAVPRDIDVLVGSSPTRQEETAAVIAAMVGHGLRLAVKLHPAETKATSKIAARFSPQEVAIHAGDEDFCDLAWRARVFVPINATSTTAFDAAEMGARVVLLHYGGVKKTAVSDAVTSAHVYSLDDLPVAVLTQVAATRAATRGDAGDRK